MQQIFRSKTMMFSLLLAILSSLQASVGLFTPYLTPQQMGMVGLLISTIVALLRVVTTQPLADK